ncbi:MAG: VWA domain-containing protein [Deltaproteobacteria bacterium]|nr:MAG: VWA domain-containing protein [Deltaproteobacteria bacterium]
MPPETPAPPGDDERLRRWRLVLGAPASEATVRLDARDLALDGVLGQLYDADQDRSGGLGGSSPKVARWLGDIRAYFPAGVVQVMQRDALERLGLTRMLLEPELLAAVEPDVHLAATLLTLSRSLPTRTRETAREVVRAVVRDVERRLKDRLVEAVQGALHRAGRGKRPRSAADIDWDRTIRKNLANWDGQRRRLVPARFEAFGRRQGRLKDVILAIDQSGSMAASVVYAGIFGAVLASLPALRTRVVAFDTEVVDLSDLLTDPVELLFGTQLGGGTDIDRALRYCDALVTRPADTVMVLVTDLFEGGDPDALVARARSLVARGVTLVCLLALTDTGAPGYDHRLASRMAAVGVPTFACTPDHFAPLLAAALARHDLARWAASVGIYAAR